MTVGKDKTLSEKEEKKYTNEDLKIMQAWTCKRKYKLHKPGFWNGIKPGMEMCMYHFLVERIALCLLILQLEYVK
ncbi:hypothetical protein F170042I7_20270 [Blautia caecimuris]